MALTRLLAIQFRNIHHADLCFHPRLNLVYGENGSGKTSLLEALSFVGLGRSFRTRKFGSVIQDKADYLSLFAELSSDGRLVKVGLRKDRGGGSLIKLNGEVVTKATNLAILQPVQVIDSDSFRLLEGGPNERRRFLDWLVFHVKHGYSDIWSSAVRSLKQRNALLKRFSLEKRDLPSVKNSEELQYWSLELSKHTAEITNLRRDVLQQFLPFVTKYHSLHADALEIGDNSSPLKLTLNPGWIPSSATNREDDHSDSKTNGFIQVLEKNLERDCRLGFTSVGFHKTDISFLYKGNPVSEVLSRGQLKRFISALLIAQIEYVRSVTSKDCVLLIDDLPAELDITNQKLIASWISEIEGVQVFVTGTQLQILLEEWPAELLTTGYNMFHVKHGEINQESCMWSKP